MEQTFNQTEFNQIFKHEFTKVNGVRLHYVIGGAGDPVVLLHGFPESWYAWRYVMPLLAQDYTVIAPDMRGFGDSEKPGEGYNGLTAAEDIYSLAHNLGYESFFLVGADLGASIGYRLTADHSKAVRRFVFIEASLPGFGLEKFMNVAEGGRWHFGFNAAGEIAETLVAGKEREYLEYFFKTGVVKPDAITPADVDEYVRVYTQPGALHSAFEYYGTMVADGEKNKRLFKEKLSLPVLAIGAAQVLKGEPERTMREVAENVRGIVFENCGHYLQEDQPQQLVEQLRQFFGEEQS